MERGDRQINHILRINQRRRIQRPVRNFINNNRTIAIFVTWPYDKDLDLKDRNELKLHETYSTGLKGNDRFNGSLDKANKFLKLFGKHISDCR